MIDIGERINLNIELGSDMIRGYFDFIYIGGGDKILKKYGNFIWYKIWKKIF